MDLSKYRTLFIEEATEHLSEMSRALLALEKEPADAAAIDSIFRMAHGIKGMAASLEYGSLTQVAHALEDRMAAIRARGAATAGGEMALLFHGLDTLESLVSAVRETGEAPSPSHPQAQSFCAANAALDTPPAADVPIRAEPPATAPARVAAPAPVETPKKKVLSP